MVDASNDDIKKSLISLAIETALLEIGPTALEKALNKLYKDYHCYFYDCYKHPEYLKKILVELFGNSYISIIKSIRQQLNEFSSQKPIKEFLEKINT